MEFPSAHPHETEFFLPSFPVFSTREHVAKEDSLAHIIGIFFYCVYLSADDIAGASSKRSEKFFLSSKSTGSVSLQALTGTSQHLDYSVTF